MKGRKKVPQYWINSFYSKDVPTFDKLGLKNTFVKKHDHFRFYEKALPASKTNLIKRRQEVSLQITFPIKLYQPEEDSIASQISARMFNAFYGYLLAL